MPFQRKRPELRIDQEVKEKLEQISKSRTESSVRIERAKMILERGYDQEAILASVKERISTDIAALKLGGDVLYSQFMCAFAEHPGVIDVQNLRLRRCPAAFGRITFGEVRYQLGMVEVPAGENLMMGPREIAIFRLDSDLIDIEVVAR